MRIVENFGRRNGKTMELAFQIADAIKGKGSVAIIPIKELIEYENQELRKFAEWLEENGYLVDFVFKTYRGRKEWNTARDMLEEYQRQKEQKR